MAKKGEEFTVLDKGFVCLIDYLGDDSHIVRAARVSHAAERTEERTVQKERNLIRYLMRHSHTSPFEQVVVTFHIKLPIFVARQWVRHRTARLNEVSGRYTVLQPEFYIPEADVIARQSSNNHQGREDEPVDDGLANEVITTFTEQQEQAYTSYQNLLEEHDISRELARLVLPLNTYTEWYWQIDLHNCFHFLALRMHEHAQYEIRMYAECIFNILQDLFPLACEAFVDYRLNAEQMSHSEMSIVRKFLKQLPPEDIVQSIEKSDLSKREQRELLDKLDV